MIEVDHNHSQGPLVAGGPADFQFQGFLHEPAVEKPGQRIADRLAAQSFVQPQVRQRHGDMFGHGHGHALLGFRHFDIVRLHEVQHADGFALRHHGNAQIAVRRGMMDMLADQTGAGIFNPVQSGRGAEPSIPGGANTRSASAGSPHMATDFHRVARRSDDIKRSDLHGENLLRHADDDVVGFFRGEAGAQNVAHVVEQSHFTRALFELGHPGFKLHDWLPGGPLRFFCAW